MVYHSAVIDTQILRRLVALRTAGPLFVRGTSGGFLIGMKVGDEEEVLEAQRGHPRCFRRLDAAARYLKGIGAEEFTVDLSAWNHKAE